MPKLHPCPSDQEGDCRWPSFLLPSAAGIDWGMILCGSGRGGGGIQICGGGEGGLEISSFVYRNFCSGIFWPMHLLQASFGCMLCTSCIFVIVVERSF